MQTFPIFDKPWAADEILQWIYKNMHQVSSWVLPNAVKSISLSKSIDEEPVLILFTPRNPLQPISDYYSLVSKTHIVFESIKLINLFVKMFCFSYKKLAKNTLTVMALN